jgi:hypothetical protein
MPPVLLMRLRPQVNALIAQSADEALFLRTLLQLLERYGERKPTTNAWLRPDPGMPTLRTSPLVMREMENALETLAHSEPERTLQLALRMWQSELYEPKHLAVHCLAHLEPPHQEAFIQHMQSWLVGDLPKSLQAELITQGAQRSAITRSPAWVQVLRDWAAGEDKHQQKLAIQAALQMLEQDEYDALPQVCELMLPLFQQPKIALHKDLSILARKLAERSPAEAAAFLISAVGLGGADAAALARKLLPLFDEFYRAEIQQVLE